MTEQVTTSFTDSPELRRLELRSAVVNSTQVEPDQRVRVTATLRNVGERADTFEPALAVDGLVVATRTVSLDPGETQTVSFEHQFEENGAHRISVASVQVADLTVVRQGNGTPVGRSAAENNRIEVVESRLSAEWVRRGYNATVMTTVTNSGNQTATPTLAVTVDGIRVVTRPVELAPDQTRTVRIEFPATEGTVAVGGVEAGRLNVSRSVDAEDPPQTQTSGPGFGFGLAVPLLVTVLLIAEFTRSRTGRE